jgi:hypothetical protein
MKLSIIIVNYNGKDLTLDCLESIYSRLDNIDFEIIVVDNASKDMSIEAIIEQFPQVAVIRNNENLGFSKANNQGIKIAKGEYVLLLNNDTLLQDGDFNNLISYMDNNDDVGILGCRINNPDGSLQLSCYKFPSMWEMFTHYSSLTRLFPNSRLFGDYRNWEHNSVREVDFVIGAFFLVKKALFDGIGLLDEDFFLNAEESEYCLRAKKADYKTAFHPGYTIIHIGGATKKNMVKKDIISHIRGTELLIRKHFNLIYFILYKFISFSLSGIRAVIFSLLYLITGKKENKNKLMQSIYLLLYQMRLAR